MYFIGYDIGSSSVKACIVDAQSGKTLGNAFFPKQEAPIICRQTGWAEQDPESWWTYLKEATAEAMNRAAKETGRDITAIREGLAAIGISYQMHGLVCVWTANKKRCARPSSGVTRAPCLTATRPWKPLAPTSASAIC